MSDVDQLSYKIDELNARAEELHRDNLGSQRAPSKAHLIGPGRDPNQPDFGSVNAGPNFFANVALARSRDYNEQRIGQEALEAMGSRPAFAPSESAAYVSTNEAGTAKANLSSTTGLGAGYLVPNALVADVVKQATAKNPLRSMLQVIEGTRTLSVQVPAEGLAPARSQVIVEGNTKTNISFVLTNYTATLYTLAQIFDVSNQLLRHSAGAAEALVRSKLARAWALGESYYIISGSGSGEPKGLLTSLTGVSDFTTAHSASDSTVAGSFRAAIAKAIQALALRNRTAEYVLCNPGDVAHAFIQGADAAGYYVNPDTGLTSILGVPIRTTTAMTTKSAVVGEFSSAQLFVGDDFRVDTSTEAGTRWDTNLTGFRAEEEIGFNADPYVSSGIFQLITGLIP
jgi:HK97 family phage major capsid protein